MRNDSAALAVACVTAVFESRQAGETLVEQAAALNNIIKDLDRAELAGMVATMSAWIVVELPDDADQVRSQLRSMGLSLGRSA